jgi:hypothetical protein
MVSLPLLAAGYPTLDDGDDGALDSLDDADHERSEAATELDRETLATFRPARGSSGDTAGGSAFTGSEGQPGRRSSSLVPRQRVWRESMARQAAADRPQCSVAYSTDTRHGGIRRLVRPSVSGTRPRSMVGDHADAEAGVRWLGRDCGVPPTNGDVVELSG